MKKISTDQIGMLLVIAIGGTFSILHPEQTKDAFTYTVGGCVLIKLFF
jgi:hypothetical protein